MNGIIEFFLVWCVLVVVCVLGWRMGSDYEIDKTKDAVKE